MKIFGVDSHLKKGKLQTILRCQCLDTPCFLPSSQEGAAPPLHVLSQKSQVSSSPFSPPEGTTQSRRAPRPLVRPRRAQNRVSSLYFHHSPTDPSYHLLLLGDSQNLPTGPVPPRQIPYIHLHSSPSQSVPIRAQMTQPSLRGQARRDGGPQPSFLPSAAPHTWVLCCSSSLCPGHSPLRRPRLGPAPLQSLSHVSEGGPPSLPPQSQPGSTPAQHTCALHLFKFTPWHFNHLTHPCVICLSVSPTNKGNSLLTGTLVLLTIGSPASQQGLAYRRSSKT